MAARPHVIDGGQFATPPPAARRAVPARAPAGTVCRIPQNLFYQFAFADDRPLLNAPTRDIDCSSSILGSDIECAEIAKCCNSCSSRRSVDLAKTGHHLMSAGAARSAHQMRAVIDVPALSKASALGRIPDLI
jgi:hypothetical protein